MDARPALISWNVTQRCNLRCAHCYLDARTLARGGDDELTLAERMALISQIAEVAPGAMLVLSGGEPLLRSDLLSIVYHATRLGLGAVLSTNGTLLNDEEVRDLMACGLRGVGISLDSLDPARHDAFRGVTGAWQRTIRGIEGCRRRGLAFQIQTTVTADNYDEIPDLTTFAAEQGAAAFNLFFLVCTGRGQRLTDIAPAQYEDLLSRLARSGGWQSGMRVRARCAPHLRRLAYQHDPTSPLLVEDASRCLAGVGYCRVAPDGQVTPCPYLPVSAGNVRRYSFATIWREATIFHQLRNPALRGRCGNCEFSSLCGGCRARAYATKGDFLGDDPWCTHQPVESASHRPNTATATVAPVWSPEAEVRLQNVPSFLREMVRRGAEAYARQKGLEVVTPALLAELRARRAHMGAASHEQVDERADTNAGSSQEPGRNRPAAGDRSADVPA